MCQQTESDYELAERAAIREFDGLLPRGQAEQLGHHDIEKRSELKEQYKQRPKSRSKIEQLRDQWSEIGKKMRFELPGPKKEELFAQWKQLSEEIIELRREH